MADVRIELGMTDGFRYLGVQPPLSDEQQRFLEAARFEDPLVAARFSTQTPFHGEPFSETGMITEAFMTPRGADRGIIEIATKIAEVLRSSGDTVEVDERLHPIGFGHYLFGGQAKRLG